MACFQVGAACAKSLFPAIGPQGAAALRLSLGAVRGRARLTEALDRWKALLGREPAVSIRCLSDY